jgi:hypothetical protein
LHIGWEPSSYVSSRESRTERKEARPEDFMDEEDLQVSFFFFFFCDKKKTFFYQNLINDRN